MILLSCDPEVERPAFVLEEYAHDIPEKDIQAVINGVMHHPELMDDPDFRAIVLANDKEIRNSGMTDFLSPGEIPHYDKAVALIRKIEQ